MITRSIHHNKNKDGRRSYWRNIYILSNKTENVAVVITQSQKMYDDDHVLFLAFLLPHPLYGPLLKRQNQTLKTRLRQQKGGGSGLFGNN